MSEEAPIDARSRLWEVAGLFLRLGFTAFGGPAAHLALIEDEVVRRRKWLDRQHFLDIVSAVNFIPGPNSTELAIHLGYLRAGFPGLMVAGICFIVPAVLIVLPLAWFYVAHSHTPDVAHALVGVKACMVSIVAVALWRFAHTGVKDWFTGGIAVLAIAAAVVLQRLAVGQSELIILACAAAAGAIRNWRAGRGNLAAEEPAVPVEPRPSPGRVAERRRALPFLLPIAAVGAGFWGQMLPVALFFLKVGATLFGSGYVLASFLHSGVVEQHRWMTESELLDAIAVGQVTPGPLLTAATFIGYVLGARNFAGGIAGGIAGGVVATAAIFLPSFIFVSVLGPVLPRVRGSRLARGALDGMNAAVVALIAVVTVWLGQSAVMPGGKFDLLSIGLSAGSLVLLLATRVNPTWVIVAAGIIGAVARY